MGKYFTINSTKTHPTYLHDHYILCSPTYPCICTLHLALHFSELANQIFGYVKIQVDKLLPMSLATAPSVKSSACSSLVVHLYQEIGESLDWLHTASFDPNFYCGGSSSAGSAMPCSTEQYCMDSGRYNSSVLHGKCGDGDKKTGRLRTRKQENKKTEERGDIMTHTSDLMHNF